MADVRKECVYAFKNGDKEMVKKLLPKLHQPQYVKVRFYCNDCTLVHCAAKWGWDDICQLLVETYDCDPTAKSTWQQSPLHWACTHGHVTVVNYLLRLPNVMRTINDKNVYGRTPLYLACRCAHLEVIKTLLRVSSITIPTEQLTRFNFAVLSMLANRIDWNTKCCIQPYFSVFMTGNSGAGKSTLATLLVELARDIPSQHGQVSGVKTLTAGVCHMQCGG